MLFSVSALRAGVGDALAKITNTDDPLLAEGDITKVKNPPMYSSLKYAVQHDARWYLAGGSHAVGSMAGTTELFSNGSHLFSQIGTSFSHILRFYGEYQRTRELVGAVESMWKYMSEYKLKINVWKMIPNLVISEPGDPFGEDSRSFIIGFSPKHDSKWRDNGDLFGDNPYMGHRKGGMSLIEVKYPHSWSDIKIDGSIWGGDSLDEDEFQKHLLAGFYDGVTSAGRFLTGVGVDNNVELSVGRLSPRNMAANSARMIDKRIAALKRQRALYEEALTNPNTDVGHLVAGNSPERLIQLQGEIDAEIVRLQSKQSTLLGNEIAKQQPWVERATFIHGILAKLENSERRITIARLSERFKKYQNAWANPGFMNAKPEITGDQRVDNAIYLIWEALTLLSSGQIAPPQGVSGGPAAEAQAVVVKSMYRTLTYEELTAIRQLLAQEYQVTKQGDGVKIVASAKDEIQRMIQTIQARADMLDKWKRQNDALEDFAKTNPNAKWAMKGSIFTM